MSTKPKNDGAARARAGVPLARAHRLANKADAKGRRNGSRVPIISLVLAIAALGGGWAYYTGQFQGVYPVVAQSAGEPAAPTAPAPTDPVAVAAETSVPAEEQATDVVASITETPVLAPRPVLAPCVEEVESRLQKLYDVDDQNLEWDIKREHIRSTIQSVLDCDTSTFALAGDFELAASNLADLEVVWDRPTAKLKLTIVDSVAFAAEQTVFTDDGQPIAFLVH